MILKTCVGLLQICSLHMIRGLIDDRLVSTRLMSNLQTMSSVSMSLSYVGTLVLLLRKAYRGLMLNGLGDTPRYWSSFQF
ncbi:hypothetical protein BDN70DRAFT_649740 [Pholiota conissans]|uniref:Uncharacterized protein n=1 Tax=Pholiota conissans TaxID=109636 RepID=A0A9P5Z2Q5_9AGAR|nr:hypothetical protein BDN70DRAFT_649740 [Pholiota conissans]